MALTDRIRDFIGLGPSHKQKVTLAQAVSVMVWADGVCHPSEREETLRILTELGDVPAETANSLLDTPTAMTPELREALLELPPEYAHQVLKLAFRIAAADGELDENEMNVIRELANLVLPDCPWDVVRKWIEAHHAFILASNELFAHHKPG